MPHDSDLREVLFPPKDEPLRQDVRLLGDLVGAVIREQGGEKLFDCVERARHAAIRRREGVAGASKELEGVLAGLPELSPDKRPGRLLTDGIYGRIRHPRYVEVLLFTVAYAFFANYVGTYVTAALTVPALCLTVILEERERRDRFGAEFEAYSRRVPRFIPVRDRRSAP